MIGILLAKCRMFVRNPWTFVIMSAMSIGFAFLLGGSHQENSIQVPIVVEHEPIFDTVVGEIINESNIFVFNQISKDELIDKIENGKAEMGVIFRENNFQMMVGVDTPNVTMLKQTIQDAYLEKEQNEKIIEVASTQLGIKKEAVKAELDEVMDNPVFSIEKSNFRGSDTFIYNSTFQSLFGFSLFFVIYTIAYNVLPILLEKKEGMWDRMILSPLKKWEMYGANFIYSFVIGYLQVIIIFFIFRFFVGVDFNGQFMEVCLLLLPYVFSIVAVSILLTSIVKNVQQFNAVIPIVSVSFAMIGGAYWPLELVESPVLLFLAKLNPVTYGMEILKGVAIYGYSFQELLFPIGILLLMGVIMIGIGIRLMERRHV
jgi:ABC-2 type transport system permease protein